MTAVCQVRTGVLRSFGRSRVNSVGFYGLLRCMMKCELRHTYTRRASRLFGVRGAFSWSPLLRRLVHVSSTTSEKAIMNYLTRSLGLAAALAVTLAGMSPAAQAAKPSLSAKELQAMANQERENYRFFRSEKHTYAATVLIGTPYSRF